MRECTAQERAVETANKNAGTTVDDCECVQLDPCDEIKKQLEDPRFVEKLEELTKPALLDKNEETGYWWDNNGDPHLMEATENNSVLLPQDRSSLLAIDHVHNNVREATEQSVQFNFTMPSVDDIWLTYYLAQNAQSNNNDPNETYISVINSFGYFQLRFTGNIEDLNRGVVNERFGKIVNKDNKDLFKKINGDNLNKISAFLNFLKDLNISDLDLYIIQEDAIGKLALDPNDPTKIIITPCNE